MYREETIRDLEDIRIRHEAGDLDDHSKDQHVMILNEFLTHVGFDDVNDMNTVRVGRCYGEKIADC